MKTAKYQNISALIKEYDKKILDFDFGNLYDGLLYGKLGLLLYFLANYQVSNKQEYQDKISKIFEEVVENCNTQKKDNIYSFPTLSKGMTGLGIILDLLKKDRFIDDDFDVHINELSEIIFEQSIKMLKENNYTFFDGPLGNLYYFNAIKNEKYSNGIVDFLYEESTTKRIPFENKLNDSFADGFNLGFNYGYLSIINNLLSLPVITEKAKSIINKCVNFIISHFDIFEIEGAKIYKPYNYKKLEGLLKPYHNYRLCWCNSDLSFCYLLYKAGQILQNSNYKKLAHEIGMETTKRKVKANTGIELVHYCHGTSGIVQLYREINKKDSQKEYKNAENFWLKQSWEILDTELYQPFTDADCSLIFGKIGALLALNDSIDKNKYLKFLL